MLSIRDSVLENGLRVIICPDAGAPTVTVTVMYRVGSHDEAGLKTGLAHLFEHLMFDNTSTGMEKQYDTYCTVAGGSNNAYTTYDYTCYYITVPSHQLEIGLWLEADRMRHFAITEEALATQRNVVVEEINQNVENQPYGRWRFAMESAAYAPESAYSWEVYGSADDVAAVTMDDAKQFFERFYGPSNAVLCISGNVDATDALAKATEYFGSIEARPNPQNRSPFDPSMLKKGSHVVEPDSVPLPAVFLAFHCEGFLTSDQMDLEVLTTALGSGRTSALYLSLVHEKRIASAAGAYLDRRAHDSLLTMYAYANAPDVTAADLAEALLDTVDSYVHTTVAHESALNKLRTSMAMELQRNRGIADTVAWTTLFWNDPFYVNTIEERFAAATVESVSACAATVLRRADAVRVDVVPREEQAADEA